MDIVQELAVIAANKAHFHGVPYAVVQDDDGIYRVTPVSIAQKQGATILHSTKT